MSPVEQTLADGGSSPGTRTKPQATGVSNHSRAASDKPRVCGLVVSLPGRFQFLFLAAGCAVCALCVSSSAASRDALLPSTAR